MIASTVHVRSLSGCVNFAPGGSAAITTIQVTAARHEGEESVKINGGERSGQGLYDRILLEIPL